MRQYSSIAEEPHIWWQTILHILSGVLIFQPLMFLFTFSANYVEIILMPTGRGSWPLGTFALDFLQYGLATFFALSAPADFLKRSNRLIVCIVAAVLSIFPMLFIVGFTFGNGVHLEGIVTWFICIIGTIIFYYFYQERAK